MKKKGEPPVEYITEDILERVCHGLAKNLFPGDEPMGFYADHDESRLQASLALPKQVVFGKELYPGIYTKAAILFYVINRNHAFDNGNKRLSVAALLVFLYLNDVIFDGDDCELRDKALWLAQTTDTIESAVAGLAAWIEKSSVSKVEYEKVVGPLP